MVFINQMCKVSRSNMTLITDHTYIIGPCKAAALTGKQCQALGSNTHDVHNTFSKLYKEGIVYRTVSNKKSNALRDDTVCIFKSEENCTGFGLINVFIAGVDPTALVYKMIRLDDAILQAGHPCRHSLLDYQEANLLGKYVVLSRKFCSAENFGPGLLFSEKIVPDGTIFPGKNGPVLKILFWFTLSQKLNCNQLYDAKQSK